MSLLELGQNSNSARTPTRQVSLAADMPATLAWAALCQSPTLLHPVTGLRHSTAPAVSWALVPKPVRMTEAYSMRVVPGMESFKEDPVGRIRRQFPPQQLGAAQRLHCHIDHAEVGVAAVQIAEQGHLLFLVAVPVVRPEPSRNVSQCHLPSVLTVPVIRPLASRNVVCADAAVASTSRIVTHRAMALIGHSFRSNKVAAARTRRADNNAAIRMAARHRASG